MTLSHMWFKLKVERVVTFNYQSVKVTCKTVSRITYTVLVETLNPAQSNPISLTLFIS